MDDKAIDDLVTSGVDTLSVSLDGASEESYLQYRVGGRFDLIKSNVRRLQDAKARLGVKRPRLLWKFVIFEHNKHEVEQVRRTYKDLGFDAYEMVPDNRGASIQAARRKRLKKSCFWPWHTMMIDWDGRIAPCCTHHDFELGNAIENDVSLIWTSEKYVNLREGLRDHSKMHPTCKGCLGITQPATHEEVEVA
jgi:radical SAM protein with 4Fe4S-binding SPASM domain